MKIANIGVLDARNVNEEIAEKITKMVNIGTYVTSDQAEGLLQHVERKNFGETIKTDETVDVVSYSGKHVCKAAAFEGLANPMILSMSGKIVFENDITVEAFNNSVLSGSINGKVVLPNHLIGPVQAKCSINGKLVGYDSGCQYVNGTVYLTDDFMMSFFGSKRIAVQKLVITEVFDEALFRETFEKLQVLEKLVIVKSQLSLAKQLFTVDGKVLLLEEPVVYKEGEVSLSEHLMAKLEDTTLHVDGNLLIEDGNVIKHNVRLVAHEILCHEVDGGKLEAVINADQKVVYFEDQPLNNYEKVVVDVDFLQALEGKVNYVNYGRMTIADDVTFEMLQEKLAICNYGVIEVGDRLKNRVHQVLTENFGRVSSEEDTKEVPKEKTPVMYANLGKLKL